MGDQCWVNARKNIPEYLKGVDQFINFVIAHGMMKNEKMRCPHVRCLNRV